MDMRRRYDVENVILTPYGLHRYREKGACFLHFYPSFASELIHAEMYRMLRNHTGDEIDTVILGCPHASIREMAEIAHLLEGKKVADGVRLWIDTARGTKGNADAMGFTRIIEDAGGQIICDSCPTNIRIPAKRIVTHGFKQAHYARGMLGAELIVAKTEPCVRAAISGRWLGD